MHAGCMDHSPSQVDKEGVGGVFEGGQYPPSLLYTSLLSNTGFGAAGVWKGKCLSACVCVRARSAM
jgi:hypothetical protein